MVKQKENLGIPSFTSVSNPEIKGARFFMIIVFLALIRCLAEPFRLEYINSKDLSFTEIRIFLIGGLTAALSLLLMTFFSFYGKHKAILITGIITILILLIEKFYVD